MSQYLYWTITHLGSWLLILIAATGAGHLLLRRLAFNSGLERAVFTLSCGLGSCAMVIYGLALIGLLYPSLILILSLCGSGVTIFYLWRRWMCSLTSGYKAWQALKPAGKLVAMALSLGAGIYTALLLVSTQFPPLHWDALHNHLIVAREVVTTHRLVPVMSVPYPVLPFLNHMLFVWSMALKDDIVAQMMEQTFFVLIALALYAWGLRRGQWIFGVAAASLWLAHPVVLLISESAYIDLGVACYCFLGVYTLYVFWRERSASWWYLAITMFCFAGAIKLPGIFLLGCAVMLGLWWVKQEPRWMGGLWLRGCVLAALLLIPWYGWITYHTGNPLWPMWPRMTRLEWGGIPEASLFNLRAFRAGLSYEVGMGRGFLDLLRVPYRMVFYPGGFQAPNHLTFFPLLMTWPLALVFIWRSRTLRWWALWALIYFLFWFYSYQDFRYWFPGAVLAGLALVESVRWLCLRLTRKPTQARTLVAGFVWAALIIVPPFHGAQFMYDRIIARGSVPPMTAQERETFFEGYSGGYRAVQYINEHADPQELTYVLADSFLFYHFKGRYVSSMLIRDTTYMIRHPALRLPEDEAWSRKLRERRINWVLVSRSTYPQMETLLKSGPDGDYFWPGYKLVYTDRWAWVFRSTDTAIANDFQRQAKSKTEEKQ